VGLLKAQRLLRAADSNDRNRGAAVRDFLEAWTAEIEDHFLQEELLLSRLMSPLHVERLQKDHTELRAFASEANQRQRGKDPGAEWSRRLGQKLNDHIRWEERELFPAIENTASAEALDQLERRTLEMESKRLRVASRREDASFNQVSKTGRPR
jgi:hemerythrin-like domain-containing protein